MRLVALLATVFFVSTAAARAFCSEPSFYGSTPSAPSIFSKPDVPYCLNEYSYSGRHTCDSWEIDSYFNDVNNYISNLNNYVEEANRLAADAASFARQAHEYASCEAKELKTQHE
jgi:hypothetical protein